MRLKPCKEKIIFLGREFVCGASITESMNKCNQCEQAAKIKELEAKLAEAKEEIQDDNVIIKELRKMVSEKQKKIDQLAWDKGDLKDKLAIAVDILESFEEFKKARDAGETSITAWYTYERVLYDSASEALVKIK